MTLKILPLHALWPIGRVKATSQLEISHCEHGMHWLDGCLRIGIVEGNVSGTLESERMGDDLEFFGEVLGLFWCFVYFIIT